MSRYHKFKKNIKNYLVRRYSWKKDKAKYWVIDHQDFIRTSFNEKIPAWETAKWINSKEY